MSQKGVKIEVRPADREFFFKFRYYLVKDKKYLTYFLNSLNQQYSDEVELMALLGKWDKIDHADALLLLSREFSLNPTYNKRKLALPILKIIRDYAVSVVSELKDL